MEGVCVCMFTCVGEVGVEGRRGGELRQKYPKSKVPSYCACPATNLCFCNFFNKVKVLRSMGSQGVIHD